MRSGDFRYRFFKKGKGSGLLLPERISFQSCERRETRRATTQTAVRNLAYSWDMGRQPEPDKQINLAFQVPDELFLELEDIAHWRDWSIDKAAMFALARHTADLRAEKGARFMRNPEGKGL